MEDVDEVRNLIEGLSDKSESYDARDDYAMYLGDSDDPRALQALCEFASKHDEDTTLLASAGESVGCIWLRRGEVDKKAFTAFSEIAKRECLDLLKVKNSKLYAELTEEDKSQP